MLRPVMRHALAVLAGCLSLATSLPCSAQPPPADRVQLRFDAAQAVAVLAIVDARSAGRALAEADWQRLVATEGYRRLKLREAGIGRAGTGT